MLAKENNSAQDDLLITTKQLDTSFHSFVHADTKMLSKPWAPIAPMNSSTSSTIMSPISILPLLRRLLFIERARVGILLATTPPSISAAASL